MVSPGRSIISLSAWLSALTLTHVSSTALSWSEMGLSLLWQECRGDQGERRRVRAPAPQASQASPEHRSCRRNRRFRLRGSRSARFEEVRAERRSGRKRALRPGEEPGGVSGPPGPGCPFRSRRRKRFDARPRGLKEEEGADDQSGDNDSSRDPRNDHPSRFPVLTGFFLRSRIGYVLRCACQPALITEHDFIGIQADIFGIRVKESFDKGGRRQEILPIPLQWLSADVL